ncbi:hypothetical protein CH63R_08390 [Colletotrichum higginsianum IMI 349063]|uniref:Uncharacterized protein n=1 Tax=Colletotrichum higginsianum (strain IMI 349063) TaxID=759273 RepID=A0A1B7YCC2_COLHI|nr:hypothetical protein CH63R_08390 [Colletotrichum higginsianum IMI 349063]OBR09625.1 hypothetical protein CH63R_08390 [Colletotrichum higginsianum IMI 349063]
MAFLKKNSSHKNRLEVKEDTGGKAVGQASSSSLPKSAPTPKAANPFPHEQLMRAKYLDQRKLKNSLDSIYGEGKYQVKVKRSSNFDLFSLTASILKDDLAQLEQRVRLHYND